MNEQYIEISRFTYFYQNLEEKRIDSKEHCPDFGNIREIVDLLDTTKIDNIFPFTKNFQDLWKDEIKTESSIQTIKKENNNHISTLIHTFRKLQNKVIIFESKICLPISKFTEAIDFIKQESKKDIYTAIIKKIIPDWKGDYSADGDYFYFINMPLTNFYSELSNEREIDLKIIDDVKNQLFINGKCIFSLLEFEDKSFPDNSYYNKDISQTISNEQQPLIVISPVKDKNKLIIFDEKLFVRCFLYNATNADLKKSLPIRLVITTVLYQRAFLEYASKALINIADERIKWTESFSELQKLFGCFIDHFWRLDMSNSLYLNKSYRIIGKIWLLNQKFDIVKQHLTRNADIEEQKKQKQFNYVLVVLSLLTITSAISDFFSYFFSTDSKIGFTYKIIIYLVLYLFALLFVAHLFNFRSRINRKRRYK